MDNRKDKIQSSTKENESADSREEFLQPNDDSIIFVPADNIRAIEKVVDTWEVVKQRWNKITKIIIF